MIQSDELKYLRRREAHSCELADGASDEGVKAIHFELAEAYAAAIGDIEEADAGGGPSALVRISPAKCS